MGTLADHQRINQNSGDVEYYTPAWVTDAAGRVMGGIDLDPASCEVANTMYVGAARYFTVADNGLSLPWVGRVWMNHPFGDEEYPCKQGFSKNGKRKCTKEKCKPKESPTDTKHRGHCIDAYQPGNKDWINKLVTEFNAGNISQACCVCFASTSETWFQPLFNYAQCYLSPRLNYISQGHVKKGVSKGSVVTYLGPHVDRFVAVFAGHGRVMIPYRIPDTVCPICLRGFTPKRSDAIYCTPACKQRAVRQRKSRDARRVQVESK